MRSDKFAAYFPGFQCVVATHMNTSISTTTSSDSVNFETGRSFHQSAQEMKQAKEYSNELCRQ
jgi:hypothetical protein